MFLLLKILKMTYNFKWRKCDIKLKLRLLHFYPFCIEIIVLPLFFELCEIILVFSK